VAVNEGYAIGEVECHKVSKRAGSHCGFRPVYD
jgi:hypothetical protein